MKRRELRRVEFLWPEDVVSLVEEHGRHHDLDRTAAALDLVRHSLEEQAVRNAERLWRDSGAQAQVDVLFSRLQVLEELVRQVAIRTFGLDELLIEWVRRSEGRKVSHQELLDEVRHAGWTALERHLDELEHGQASSCGSLAGSPEAK